MDLYHFTCAHRVQHIRDDGIVVPGQHLKRDDGLPATAIPWSAFAWFTDLSVPAREPLGLTMELLRCDRTAFRFRALTGSALMPWLEVRRGYPWRHFLESPGTRPGNWYVSAESVPVIEDPLA
jgi:hypothetical protein